MQEKKSTQILVYGTHILVGDCLKYLGVLLDDTWRFGLHFEPLAPKVEKVSAALSRFLPNLRSGWSSPPYIHEYGELCHSLQGTGVGGRTGGRATRKDAVASSAAQDGRQSGTCVLHHVTYDGLTPRGLATFRTFRDNV